MRKQHTIQVQVAVNGFVVRSMSDDPAKSKPLLIATTEDQVKQLCIDVVNNDLFPITQATTPVSSFNTTSRAAGVPSAQTTTSVPAATPPENPS